MDFVFIIRRIKAFLLQEIDLELSQSSFIIRKSCNLFRKKAIFELGVKKKIKYRHAIKIFDEWCLSNDDKTFENISLFNQDILWKLKITRWHK